MGLIFFEGPAGSGKTTRLFQELELTLEAHPLGENERILALTKMHGSRRRMLERLLKVPGLRGRFVCATVDSFAWSVLQRWRSLARCKGIGVQKAEDYEEVCKSAGTLLGETVVRVWVASTFPILLVDEMQDSKEGQLEIVRSLSESIICISAGDGYQDLDATDENAAISWATQNGQVISLAQNHRTTAMGLLAAAHSLRNGEVVPDNGGGFTVLGAQNKDVGASFVSRNLTWWRRSNDIAVITPVRAERSLFVRELIQRVEERSIGNPTCGPHRVQWEVSQEDECEQFLEGLGLPAVTSRKICASDICQLEENSSSKALTSWLDRQRRVAGRTTFTVSEIQETVRLIHQRSRAYRFTRNCGVRAMTIHQAKNREFDSVIVLWPYEIRGDVNRQRRLLYNAVTRAKRQAIVIVQNPSRLTQPPFVPVC